MINNYMKKRQLLDSIFRKISFFVTFSSIVILAILIYHVSITGFSKITFDFFENFPSRFPSKAGIKSALYGSIWMLSLVTIISVPFGVATALYLEEYGNKNKINRLIEINI